MNKNSHPPNNAIQTYRIKKISINNFSGINRKKTKDTIKNNHIHPLFHKRQHIFFSSIDIAKVSQTVSFVMVLRSGLFYFPQQKHGTIPCTFYCTVTSSASFQYSVKIATHIQIDLTLHNSTEHI